MNDGEGDLDSLRLTLSPPGQNSNNASSSASASASASSSSPAIENPWSTHNASPGVNDSPGATGARGRGSLPAAARSRRAGGGALTGTPSRAKEERIVPPYPWATERRAVVHSLEYLLSQGILAIRGDLVCKRCDGKESREVDLQGGFLGLSSFFLGSKDTMHDRAPKVWMVPRLLDCGLCHQSDCVKPVIDDKKRRINWLFLLLTQTLGLCTLDQLKYFCKHTKKHRTGAKDRVLYLTYVGLLKQLNPSGPYE